MLYLASRSPRRRELLARLGLEFSVLELDVPEQRRQPESPAAYVARVARDKALAGLALVAGQPDALVLGCDTEVVMAGTVFGKPRDSADAIAMLERLSAGEHEVISAVCLLSASREDHAVSVSTVRFATLSRAVITAYVDSGEPFGKAGGYAIQGLAEAFVQRLDGSYSGVMGLPLHLTAQLLAGFGVGPLAVDAAATALEAP